MEKEMAQKNQILKVVTGSHLHGTSTPQSDHDYAGIFLPDKPWVLGRRTCEQVSLRTNPDTSGKRNTKEDVDFTVYDIRKFFKLAGAANPNILEIFYAPKECVLECEPAGRRILDSVSLFLSRKVADSFCGYARSQKRKMLVKRARLDSLIACAAQVEILLKEGKEFPDESVFYLDDGKAPKYFDPYFPLVQVKKRVQQEMDEYGNRTESVNRWGYDTKFASHMMRFMEEGIQLLHNGEITFPLPHANFYREIKQGKYSADDILSEFGRWEKDLEDAAANTNLPKDADWAGIEKLQIELIEEHLVNQGVAV